MKIASLSWTGVAGLVDGSADLSRQGGLPADCVAVTGPSGSGKSRLLYAIAHAKERLAAYGSPAPNETITGRDGAAKIQLTWALTEAEQTAIGLPQVLVPSEVLYPPAKGFSAMNDPALLELLERYSHSPEVGKLDYVPPDRVLPRSFTVCGDFVNEQRRKRLSFGSEKYAAMRGLVVDAVRRRDPRVIRLQRLFMELCPGRKLGAATADADLELITLGGRPGALRTAASSEWEAFSIAATMVFVGLSGSIVLYDTPELHLDEEEAARRLSILRSAFPTTQFIVATKAKSIVESASIVLELGAAR